MVFCSNDDDDVIAIHNRKQHSKMANKNSRENGNWCFAMIIMILWWRHTYSGWWSFSLCFLLCSGLLVLFNGLFGNYYQKSSNTTLVNFACEWLWKLSVWEVSRFSADFLERVEWRVSWSWSSEKLVYCTAMQLTKWPDTTNPHIG